MSNNEPPFPGSNEPEHIMLERVARRIAGEATMTLEEINARRAQLAQQLAADQAAMDAPKREEEARRARMEQAQRELAEVERQEQERRLQSALIENNRLIGANQQARIALREAVERAEAALQEVEQAKQRVDATFQAQQSHLSRALNEHGNLPGQNPYIGVKIDSTNSEQYALWRAYTDNAQLHYQRIKTLFGIAHPGAVALHALIARAWETPAYRLRQGITYALTGQSVAPVQQFDADEAARVYAEAEQYRRAMGG